MESRPSWPLDNRQSITPLPEAATGVRYVDKHSGVLAGYNACVRRGSWRGIIRQKGPWLREVGDERIDPFARDVLHRKNVIVSVILRSDSHRLTRERVLANQVVVRSAESDR
jgi:hypothetical protein